MRSCVKPAIIPTAANLLLLHLEGMARADLAFGPPSTGERSRCLEYAGLVKRLGTILEDHR